MKTRMNLYPYRRTGYYIYLKGNDRFFAQRKYPAGYRKSALFYSLEDARLWIDCLI